MAPDIERKLAAILSADVAGYSRLMAEDEVATVRTLTEYRGVMGTLVRDHRGRVVDSPGDNLLAEFPSALDGVQAAIEIQRALATRNADLPPERMMQFRIGVHLGDVLVEGARIYGDGVNIAARLEALADTGGVCVSATVYEQVRTKLSVDCEDLGPRTVKNIPQPVQIYRVRMTDEATEGPRLPRASELSVTGLAGRPDVAVLVVPAVWVFSVAVVFEVFFMASPFALYYYSAYGLSLNWLHASTWTTWLTEFFLPHFSQTSSPLLNQLPLLGGLLVILGTVLFLVGFVHVYWAKIRGRGPVTGGLYTVFRHPQYVALAIAGLGTLLVWPRFLVLISYITMLFLYAALARWEEQRCLRKFGESYRAYLDRTGKLSRMLFERLPRLLPRNAGRRSSAILAIYLVVVAATVGLGYRLRDYSLSKLSSLYAENMAVISLAVLTQEELSTALRVAMTDAAVREALDRAGPSAPLIVYVVPMGWEVADLPMEMSAGPTFGHHASAGFDRQLYKVLFTQARTHEETVTGREIIKRAYGRDPLTLAHVNIGTEQVIGIEPAAPYNVRWGDIPTPLF